MLLQNNDIIILKDLESLKNNPNGLTLTVLESRFFKNNLSEWEIYKLENDLFLVLQSVDKIVEYGVYFYAEKDIGNRKDALENGMEILFETRSLDSSYSNRILWNGEIEFTKKLQEFPCKTNDNKFALVVEWEASGNGENQLIVTEVGDGPDGGLITFLRGSHISSHEIEILKGKTCYY